MPGSVSIEWAQTWSWRNQFACYYGDLIRPRRDSLLEVRDESCDKVLKGIELLCTDRLSRLGESMFIWRTKGEVDYLETFRSITGERLESWRGTTVIDPAAWVWDRAQLHVEFSCLRKNSTYWNMFCRNECHLRSKHGCFIPYQFLATFGLGSEFFRHTFACLTAFGQQIDVPRCCNVELPPVFFYGMRELVDPDSSWRVVAYTEFDAKTAAFIMFEVNDSCSLWALSRKMVRGIRRLHLKETPGNAGNVSECLVLLEAIERSHFRDLRAECAVPGM